MKLSRTLFAILAFISMMLKIQAVSFQHDTLANDSIHPPRVLSSSGNLYDDFNASVPQYVPKTPTVSGLVEQIDYPVSKNRGSAVLYQQLP